MSTATTGSTRKRTRGALAPPVPNLDPDPEVLDRLSDEDLGRRAAEAGCHAAWQVLYERSRAPLRRYALSLGVGKDHADDLVQDTLLRAWEKRTLYDPEYAYRGWIRTILFRLATTEQTRDQGRRDLLAREGEVGGERWRGHVHQDVVRHTLQRLIRDRLDRILTAMSDQDREILSAWSEGARTVELAVEWGENPATLRTRLHRAKQKLADAYLEAYEMDGPGID